MFGAATSLLLLGSIWEPPDHSVLPLTGGPKALQKTEITESFKTYSARFKGKN